MGFVFQDQGNATAYSADALIASAVNVAAGDLIVVGVGTLDNAAVYCTGISDDSSNSYTLRSAVLANYQSMVVGYAIANGNNAALDVTAAFGVGTTRKNMYVAVFRPDAGDTVSFDDGAIAASTYSNSPWQTAATLDTAETDEVVVAFFQGGSDKTFSNQEVPATVAATVLTSAQANITGFYRILTATIASALAETDTSAGGSFCADCVAFKSVAGAGGGLSIPVAMAHYRRLRRN